MGLFCWILGKPAEEKRVLKPLGKEFKDSIDRYISRNYGIPYVTQEEKAAEIARRKADLKRKKEEEERRKKQTEEKKSSPDNDEKPTSVSEPGVRYSLPTNDDIDALSHQADDFFYLNKNDPYALYRKPAKAYEMETFTDCLMEYMRRSGMDNAEIYKRANLSKAVFSSILTKKHIPKKGTVVALAIALRLNLKETERLLMKAGYTFSNGIKGDLIAVYFINNRFYDIDELNSALYEHGEPLLGSKSY